jgi:DNA polymerase I
MPTTERLFLLDGMALAYRAYYSFITRPLINSKGENTSAIYGFVTALMKILEDEKPEHIAVVFDTKGPTFRHKKFPDYKATRQKMPEDMSSQMEKLKDVVKSFNVPSIELPGFEADDIIGTLARRAEKENVITFMVTPDKDYMQLISSKIKMYKPGKGGGEVEIIDETGVKEKFGVRPDQVIDVLGLIGDSSDNVPGVPGIGPKTATPLIQRFGSIPSLYDQLDAVQQKGIREKLASNKDLAFLSRELVTIDINAPVQIDFHQLKATNAQASKLIKVFDELEFKTLSGRLRTLEKYTFSSSSNQEMAEVISAVADTREQLPHGDISSDQHQYICMMDLADLRTLCKQLATKKHVVIDTETTSQNAFLAKLVGISLCFQERQAFYIPIKSSGTRDGELFADTTVSHEPNHTSAGLPLEHVLKELKPILENPAIGKIGQNIKYDMLVFHCHGVEVAGTEFDTMVGSYILRADGQHSLDAIAMEFLNYKMVSFEELVGKGKKQKHITEVPIESVVQYSAEDADITMRVYGRLLDKLKEKELIKLCKEIEFPLIDVLKRMEATGICLDSQYLKEMSKNLKAQIKDLVDDILKFAGETFNINSTQQLGDILFKRLGLRTVRKTKTGFSTDVNVLEELRGDHPIIERLLEYRQISKLKSTYVDALPGLVNPKTGRVHASFNQTVAATGRLSGSDPNLQNIPIRTELGRAIRKAFIPEKGDSVMMSADYSQIELRVMAHVSGDEGLMEAFLNKEDIHSSTAAKIFGVNIADVTPLMRRKAKEVNFGIMYGIGPFGLSNRLEISQVEAKEIIKRYFERFPKVKQYINETISTARSRGYVSTLTGRRRYLPEITSRNQNTRGNAERQAINMPIQGTAADMIKIAMINIDRAIRDSHMQSRMLLQVHDELVFEIPTTEQASMITIVQERMRNAMPLAVPIEVELGTGRNWLEAH